MFSGLTAGAEGLAAGLVERLAEGADGRAAGLSCAEGLVTVVLGFLLSPEGLDCDAEDDLLDCDAEEDLLVCDEED